MLHGVLLVRGRKMEQGQSWSHVICRGWVVNASSALKWPEIELYSKLGNEKWPPRAARRSKCCQAARPKRRSKRVARSRWRSCEPAWRRGSEGGAEPAPRRWGACAWRGRRAWPATCASSARVRKRCGSNADAEADARARRAGWLRRRLRRERAVGARLDAELALHEAAFDEMMARALALGAQRGLTSQEARRAASSALTWGFAGMGTGPHEPDPPLRIFSASRASAPGLPA